MNEEEKNAIEELSKKAVICNYEERDYPNMICFKKDMIIVLNLIEKLQKENEELKNQEATARRINELLVQRYSNSIPVQKIKDKIEEINKAYEDSKDENGESEYYYPDYTIRVLEELLESE